MNSKIRTICIFSVKRIYFWEGNYYTYGGFGKWLEEFANYFQSVVLVAHIMKKRPTGGWYMLSIKNVNFFWLPIPKFGEISVLLLLPVYFYKSMVASRNAELLMCRMPDYTGIIGNIIGRIYNKKRVNLIVDDWGIQARNTNWKKKCGLGLLLKLHLYIYDFLEKVCCKNELVLAQGETSYQKHFLKAKKTVSILSTSLSKADLRTEIVTSKILQHNEINIINIARITSVKNQKLLIDLVHFWNSDKKNLIVKLHIIGEGPLRNEIEEYVKKKGIIEFVTFYGQIEYGPAVWDILDKSDVFILTSISEGTPKVLLESMARKVPVIAPLISGVPSIIQHYENGLLYSVNDFKSLVSMFTVLVNDQGLYKNLIDKGFETAKNNLLSSRNYEMINLINQYFGNDN